MYVCMHVEGRKWTFYAISFCMLLFLHVLAAQLQSFSSPYMEKHKAWHFSILILINIARVRAVLMWEWKGVLDGSDQEIYLTFWVCAGIADLEDVFWKVLNSKSCVVEGIGQAQGAHDSSCQEISDLPELCWTLCRFLSLIILKKS